MDMASLKLWYNISTSDCTCALGSTEDVWAISLMQWAGGTEGATVISNLFCVMLHGAVIL